MTDKLTPIQRHLNMAAIHAKDTKPEMVVRKWLHSNGFRYRLNHPRLPGKPDIVLRKYRTCVFVNGCFWHGHNVGYCAENSDLVSSDCCKIPSKNRDFWVSKIVRNKQRDVRVIEELKSMGWNCITVWECQLKTKKQREITLIDLLAEIRGRGYVYEEEVPISIAAEEEEDYNCQH